MSDTLEEQLLTPSGTGTLSCVLYTPSGTPRSCVLFCNPLFEERKSSQRVMVDCARALAADGVMVLRFDYRGCGDSQGALRDFTPTDWVADIKNAAQLLKDRSGGTALGILGLRLGANLAVSSTRQGLATEFLVLWEPIPDGKPYIAHELRRKVLREMVTFGTGKSSRQSSTEQLAAGESVDLDGYELTPEIASSIESLSLLEDLSAIEGPLYLSNITHGDEPSKEMMPIHNILKKKDQYFDLIKEQPFWNRIGLVECTELIQKTQSWIKNYK